MSAIVDPHRFLLDIDEPVAHASRDHQLPSGQRNASVISFGFAWAASHKQFIACPPLGPHRFLASPLSSICFCCLRACRVLPTASLGISALYRSTIRHLLPDPRFSLLNETERMVRQRERDSPLGRTGPINVRHSRLSQTCSPVCAAHTFCGRNAMSDPSCLTSF